MSKKIYLEDKGKAYLRRVFKCTNVMVWKALTFKSESELARKIRYVALKEMGGVPNWKSSEVETTHEESEHTMTQTFGERVRLVVSKVDSHAVVYIDGIAEREIEKISVAELMSMQQELELRAAAL